MLPKGFRVEDITFKNARMQSEIAKEIEVEEDYSTDDIKAPVSLTPEQVKTFFLSKINASKDSNEKRVYSQTIKWIDELLDTKKKLLALEEKEEIRLRVEKESSEEDDI